MFGLSLIKIRLSALLASFAVTKTDEELAENRTESHALSFAPFLGVTKANSFAYNGDVAVIINNYETRTTHLPKNFAPVEVAENFQNWFPFESLEPMAELLKRKSLEAEMKDAAVCCREGEDEAPLVLAFSQKQEIPAKVDTPPDNLDIIKVIDKLQIDKNSATTAFTVNVRDMSRVCDYLKKVGDDFIEIKITNDGKTMIFTSSVRNEPVPQVACYLKIRWGNHF